MSIRKISVSLVVARSTVKECLKHAKTAGVGWPVPADVDDAQLEARLYPVKPLAPDIALPDFAHMQRELVRPGVTRLLLWQEYRHSTQTVCSTARSAISTGGLRAPPNR